jgi:siroheme synthase
MGVEHRALIEEQLVRGGLAQSTPVAVIERAWTQRQRTTRATLGELGALDVAAPAVMVIGAVAALDVRTRRFANVGAA